MASAIAAFERVLDDVAAQVELGAEVVESSSGSTGRRGGLRRPPGIRLLVMCADVSWLLALVLVDDLVVGVDDVLGGRGIFGAFARPRRVCLSVW